VCVSDVYRSSVFAADRVEKGWGEWLWRGEGGGGVVVVVVVVVAKGRRGVV
jgi:hypothetical protein